MRALTAVVGLVIAVLGSGCGLYSSVAVEHIEDLECRPHPAGERSICRTEIHFVIEVGAENVDGLLGSIDFPDDSVWFDEPVSGDGTHSQTVAYIASGTCEEGTESVYVYAELYDEDEGTVGGTDAVTATLDRKCVED